jgi:hypothetical protein
LWQWKENFIMPATLKYGDAAASFLEAFPIGSTVRGQELIDWATDHSDGLAADLLIGDQGKQVSALCRHLNQGGSDYTIPEAARFRITVTDAKRQVMEVRRLADHVYDKATGAFDKSISGALNPLKSSRKAIADIKLEELEPTLRAELEDYDLELSNTQTEVAGVLKQRAEVRTMARIESMGYSREQAQALIAQWPRLHKELKLIEKAS